MDPTQKDRVSIVVPDEDAGRLLLDRAIFRNAVINEINFYDPTELDNTPLSTMMDLAIDQGVESQEDGRFQAILLFTDAGRIDQQLDFDSLVGRAEAIGIPIITVILGSRADPNEIDNVARLTEPTNGAFVHMPEPEATDQIYATLRDHGTQHLITYSSSVSSPGQHTITADLSGTQTSANFELELLPPVVELRVDNSQPIRRIASSSDADLASAEPSSQPIAARVFWPDDRERRVAELILSVNGEVQESITDPVSDADGLIAFDWDISELDQGTYELTVLVADEFGLEAQSDPLPMMVEFERVAETVQTPEKVEVEPTAILELEDLSQDAPQNLRNNLELAGAIVAVLIGLLVLAVAVILILLLVRRRRKEPDGSTPVKETSPDQTQIIKPAFVSEKAGDAYLEPLENAPDHQENVRIVANNVAIGRDPNLSDIVFADKSVSRLHARIVEGEGVYRLYDEGSASGTYVNYEQLELSPKDLADNDDIHIGRVHLRFHVTVIEADSTQIMPAPQQAAEERESASDDDSDLSTQPYLPHQPKSPEQVQPLEDDSADDDADDVSTQPFLPHQPKR
jgi:hypothetical protein